MPDVQVSFGANIEKLVKGVEGAKEAIGSVKESVDRVSEGAKHLAEVIGVAFTVEGIKSFVESMANLGLQTERTMATLGLTAEQATTLSGVAKLTGTSMEGLTLSIERMALNIQKAKEGTSQSAAGLEVLGLKAKELIGLPTEQYFEKLAEAVGKFNPSLNLTTAVMAVGGRGVAQLLPLLQQGAEHFRELQEQVRETGATLNDAQAKAFAETHEKLTLMGLAAEGVGIKIFSVLKPAIDKAADAMRDWLQSLTAEKIQSAVSKVGEWTLSLLSTVGHLVLQISEWIDGLARKADDLKSRLAAATGGAAAGALGGAVVGGPVGAVVGGLGGGAAGFLFGGTGGPESPAGQSNEAREAFDRTIDSWRESWRRYVDTMKAGLEELGPPMSAMKLNAKAMDLGKDSGTKAALSAINEQIKLINGEYAMAVERINTLAKLGQVTETQKTSLLLAELDKRHGAEMAELGKEKAIGNLSAEQFQEIKNKMLSAEQKFQADRQKIIDQGLLANAKAWESNINTIVSAWNSQLRGLLTHTTTWAQAMRSVISDLVVKMIEKFEELAVVKPFEKMLQDIPAPTEFLSGIIKMITSSVGQVFAGTSAFFAPILGPGAPAAAAGVAAGVEGTALSMAKLEVGTWRVPSILPAILHPGEMVVPPPFADGLRASLLGSKGSGGSGGAGGAGNLTVNFSHHGNLTKQQLREHAYTLARELQSIIRDNPSLSFA